MRPAMKLLARLKFLRGTALDPFGRTAERRMERALIGEYEETVATLLAGLRGDNVAAAAEIARLPETLRGFGPIKQKNAAAARAKGWNCCKAMASNSRPAHMRRRPEGSTQRKAGGCGGGYGAAAGAGARSVE